jgi:hypothetical protein
MRAIRECWLAFWCGGIALAFVFPLANCSKTCTEAGCKSGAAMSINMQSTPGSLAGQTATVCRNSECYSALLPTTSTASSASRFPFAGTTHVNGELWALPDQSTRLNIEWRNMNDTQPQSADRYTVSLTDAAGTSSTLLDKTATYLKASPNGDDCGPICWYANLSP